MRDTIAWALAGTGGISNQFVTGLKAARGARALAAVSRTKEAALDFARKHGMEKAYGDYDEMLADPAVDIVYIGTPHTTHRELVLKAIRAGKAVLCEKPVCINSAEFAELCAAAGERGVFFMEAMWTRFVPPVCKVREWLAQGLIGEVRMVQANFGFRTDWEPQKRLLNPNLGGGALLDAGVYPVSFASMVLGPGAPEKISSLINLGETGVDEECAAIVSWGGPRIAVLSAALRTALVSDAWISGDRGRIHVPSFVFAHSASIEVYGKYSSRWEGDFVSNGYNYEAEEVMSCLREGKTESPVMSLDESAHIMKIMDEIRAQGHLKYPSEAR
jgi:predicted dehydrogenase